MNDGRELCLRPLDNRDAPLIEAGIKALSDESRYHRFFSGFEEAPPSVLERLTNIDNRQHIAWGAVDASLPKKPAIAAAHIIQSDSMPENQGDFAVAVLDDYHHQGVARALIACLFADAVHRGFTHVTFDVLTQNKKGLSLFKWLGAKTTESSAVITHMTLKLKTALTALENADIEVMKDLEV